MLFHRKTQKVIVSGAFQEISRTLQGVSGVSSGVTESLRGVLGALQGISSDVRRSRVSFKDPFGGFRYTRIVYAGFSRLQQNPENLRDATGL